MAKILLVDDEIEFVEMIAFRLAKTGGYDVVSAYDGEEGLRKARSEHPDLIILDIWMPKKDGYQVIKELKGSEETARIPVIFLAASNLPQTLEKVKAAGGADYILKPFDPPVLMTKIKTVLEKNNV
ncbi:MAG TPA: response regulator [Candidatus Sulfotelmatobacter sp.]|nr:response regulator [Candidatus Sulfotelmatobacter sp.]